VTSLVDVGDEGQVVEMAPGILFGLGELFGGRVEREGWFFLL
jgi:hypothetical protein